MLGLPLNRADFVATVDGNTAAADSLLSRIKDSKDPEVAELSRRLEVVTSSDGVTYEDITDYLADDLYGARGKQTGKPAAEPPKKTGIQGKDKAAPPEKVERVEGVDSSQQSLDTTPAATEPQAEEGGPKASPAAVKAAKQFGVDLKNVKPTGKGGAITQKDVLLARKASGADPAASGETADKPAAAPAADTAGETVDDANDDAAGTHPFGQNFITAGSEMNSRTFANPPMANFTTDTLAPPSRSDPMRIGIRDLLLNRNASSGVDAVGAFLPQGSQTVMPDTGMPNVPPPPKYNPFASVDWSKYGATGLPSPGAAPDAAPAMGNYNPFLMGSQTPTKPSLLDALTDNINPSGGAIGTYGPDPNDVLNPAGGSYGQYGPFDSFDPVSGIDASGGAGGEYGPPDPMMMGLNEAGGATGDFGPDLPPGFRREMPKDPEGPWQPTNSMAANFFKAMGLPGGERFMTVGTAPIDSSLDFMANHPKLTAAGLVGAGLGLTRLNQSPPNPNAVSQEQADKDALELRAARQRLAEQSRRGAPAVIPER